MGALKAEIAQVCVRVLFPPLHVHVALPLLALRTETVCGCTCGVYVCVYVLLHECVCMRACVCACVRACACVQ